MISLPFNSGLSANFWAALYPPQPDPRMTILCGNVAKLEVWLWLVGLELSLEERLKVACNVAWCCFGNRVAVRLLRRMEDEVRTNIVSFLCDDWLEGGAVVFRLERRCCSKVPKGFLIVDPVVTSKFANSQKKLKELKLLRDFSSPPLSFIFLVFGYFFKNQ